MNIGNSIKKVLTNGIDSFRRYPAALTNFLLMTAVNIVRVLMDSRQSGNEFLFNVLSLAFIFGAVFSIAAAAFARTHDKGKGTFVTANILGLAVSAIAAILLYFFGGKTEAMYGNTPLLTYITSFASTRIWVLSVISAIGYIYFVTGKGRKKDISGTLFMLIKGILLGFLFGLVFYLGTTGIYTAVKMLLINDLTYKIPQILTFIALFLGFSIFTGYLPEYDEESLNDIRTNSKGYPAFFTVLLDYILIPVFLILSLVLLLWVFRNMTGGKVMIEQLYSITTSYVTGGLFLLVLVRNNVSASARTYRKVFPFIAVFFLIYEAFTMVRQIMDSGIRTSEYMFILTIIGALAASIYFIARKEEAHWMILVMSAILLAISIAPVINYRDLPARIQTSRLQRLLTEAGMFKDGKIVKGNEGIDAGLKKKITYSTDYLVNQNDLDYPEWLDRNKIRTEGFSAVMGFERESDKGSAAPDTYHYVRVNDDSSVSDISGYTHMIQGSYISEDDRTVEIQGKKGKYTLVFTNFSPKNDRNGKLSEITVKNPDGTEEKISLNDYYQQISDKYFNSAESKDFIKTELGFTGKTKDMSFMIKFRSIEMNSEKGKDNISYLPEISEVLVKEN